MKLRMFTAVAAVLCLLAPAAAQAGQRGDGSVRVRGGISLTYSSGGGGYSNRNCRPPVRRCEPRYHSRGGWGSGRGDYPTSDRRRDFDRRSSRGRGCW